VVGYLYYSILGLKFNMLIMDVSVILAKFWGIYFLIFSVLILGIKDFLKKMFSYSEDEKFLVLTGFISLFIGLLHVILHSIFELDWRLMITLVGYLILFKGIMRLAFPQKVIKMIAKVKLISRYYLGGIMMILGLIFLFFV